MYLCIYLFMYLFIYLFFLCVSLSRSLSVCLSVYISISVSHIHHFNSFLDISSSQKQRLPQQNVHRARSRNGVTPPNGASWSSRWCSVGSFGKSICGDSGDSRVEWGLPILMYTGDDHPWNVNLWNGNRYKPSGSWTDRGFWTLLKCLL